MINHADVQQAGSGGAGSCHFGLNEANRTLDRTWVWWHLIRQCSWIKTCDSCTSGHKFSSSIFMKDRSLWVPYVMSPSGFMCHLCQSRRLLINHLFTTFPNRHHLDCHSKSSASVALKTMSRAESFPSSGTSIALWRLRPPPDCTGAARGEPEVLLFSRKCPPTLYFPETSPIRRTPATSLCLKIH